MSSGRLANRWQFPPYTGGCIAGARAGRHREKVSFLYGRVYRWYDPALLALQSFLPIREGVSCGDIHPEYARQFPPCTGGHTMCSRVFAHFLPVWEGVSVLLWSDVIGCQFPPYMGGCIGRLTRHLKMQKVSSLHGRVYRLIHAP